MALHSVEAIGNRSNQGKWRMQHMWPDFLVTKSPLLPFTSRICPTNGPKVAKIDLECAYCLIMRPRTEKGPQFGLHG